MIGFVGVLIVTNPGRNSFTLGALFALGNAVLYGSVTVAVRSMTKTESANTLMIWQLTVIAFFHSFLLLFGVRWPAPIDTLMMFGMGFLNAVGQYFWTQSLSLAPATAVAPFYYLMLVWALGFGYFIWGDIPSAGLLTGSAIVVSSGFFYFGAKRGCNVPLPLARAFRPPRRRRKEAPPCRVFPLPTPAANTTALKNCAPAKCGSKAST